MAHVDGLQTIGSIWPEWRCPDHGRLLEPVGAALECPQGHSYEVHRGIPRFVRGSTYVDNFGLQWNTYMRTQLDSYTGKPITRERLRRALGEELWHSLAGKQVLECGCGAGRFTEILLELGARVTSLDLSSAVDANAFNFPIGTFHRVAQADILRLPFTEHSFDVVVCLGVVPFTPNPETAIARLYRHVRPGGSLVIDHFTQSFRSYTALPLWRAVVKRLPPQRALAVTKGLVNVLLPWHKRVANVRLARAILGRFSPVRSYYNLYPELSDELQREWSLLDTHNALTGWYEHMRTPRQIRRVFEELEIENIYCERGGNGVEARGTRSAAPAEPLRRHAG